MPGAAGGRPIRAEGSLTTKQRGWWPTLTWIHFGSDDLARMRLSQAPAPLVETVSGLVEMRRSLPGPGSRRHTPAQRAFPATARPVFELIPPTGYWPEFLDPPLPDLEVALELVGSTPKAELRRQIALAWRRSGRPPQWLRHLADGDTEMLRLVHRGLRDFHAACIAPRWPQILNTFHSDIADRTSVLAAGGVGELLSTLHKDLTLGDQVLERSWRSGELWLSGRGLQLVPSMLWSGPPLFSLQPEKRGGNFLIYSAQPAVLPDQDRKRPDRLRDLAGVVGRSRAEILDALQTPCNTTELAARAHISPASASEHATVLRQAGLIWTKRTGRGVRHSLTPLGRRLQKGC